MKRSNLIFVFVALVCVSSIASTVSAAVTDQEDLWTSEDIVQLDAVVSEGVLTVQVSERNPLNDFNYIEIFLDTDQNHTTGDTRIGCVGGMDYRISCLTGMLHMYNLHRLPTEDWGEQITPFSDISGASFFVDGNTLTVKLPVDVLGGTTAVDVFAVAHMGDRPDPIIGNGDRCPEAGSLDTSTGEVVVRQPGVPLDVTFNDPEDDNQNGQDLTSARFHTFDDQFQIILTFADPIDLSDYFYELSGAVIMDSDRDLLTGFSGMGNMIPTWGGDIELYYTINCLTPPTFLLRYADCKGCLWVFGPPNSDGRWLVYGNQLIITGSLSVFDARVVAGTVDDGVWEVDRRTTDGQMITTVHTSDYAELADSMPEGGRAFDTGTGQVLEPLVWDPDVTISETDPEEFGEVSGMDLIQVDVEVVESHLVVKGDLSRWDATDRDNVFEILLDTDMNTATGEPAHNDLTPGQPDIGADYKLQVYCTDEYTHIGYYANLVRPDGVIEPHGAILFAQPSSLGPASFTVTIPLEALGNPTSELRLFVTTGRTSTGLYDVAPPYPIHVNLAENGGTPDIDITPVEIKVELKPGGTTSKTLAIRNEGDGDLTYSSIAISYDTSSSTLATIDAANPGKIKKAVGTMDAISSTHEIAVSADDEIGYDDGEDDTGYYWTIAGPGMGVHFTSPNHSTLKTARFFIDMNNSVSSNSFDWKVLGWTGSMSGSEIASGTTTPANNGWHDVNVGGITVSEDFVIAMYWRQGYAPALRCDSDPPIDKRSWNYKDAWSRWDGGDYMIRAVMGSGTTPPPPGDGWLSVDKTSGTVAPSDCDDVVVTIDATDLEIGSYSATIVISSDDPDEGTVTVPVTLEVIPPNGDLMEGDANGDGCVSLKDSTAIKLSLVGMMDLTAAQIKCADTNDDDKVSLEDSALIREWLVDKSTKLWESPADDGMERPVEC